MLQNAAMPYVFLNRSVGNAASEEWNCFEGACGVLPCLLNTRNGTGVRGDSLRMHNARRRVHLHLTELNIEVKSGGDLTVCFSRAVRRERR